MYYKKEKKIYPTSIHFPYFLSSFLFFCFKSFFCLDFLYSTQVSFFFSFFKAKILDKISIIFFNIFCSKFCPFRVSNPSTVASLWKRQNSWWGKQRLPFGNKSMLSQYAHGIPLITNVGRCFQDITSWPNELTFECLKLTSCKSVSRQKSQNSLNNEAE